MGYAGGRKANPTYHSLGGHMETIQIDYDPARISYQELLRRFWGAHNPFRRPWSRQYASAIFYGDQKQKALALASLAQLEAQRGMKVKTEILALEAFYPAEDYHQKYHLRHNAALLSAFRALYPSDTDQAMLRSTVAARLNGYLGGEGSLALLAKELPLMGIPLAEQCRLWDIMSGKRPFEEVACPLPPG